MSDWRIKDVGITKDGLRVDFERDGEILTGLFNRWITTQPARHGIGPSMLGSPGGAPE
jgi:hypothetical protein